MLYITIFELQQAKYKSDAFSAIKNYILLNIGWWPDFITRTINVNHRLH